MILKHLTWCVVKHGPPGISQGEVCSSPWAKTSQLYILYYDDLEKTFSITTDL